MSTKIVKHHHAQRCSEVTGANIKCVFLSIVYMFCRFDRCWKNKCAADMSNIKFPIYQTYLSNFSSKYFYFKENSFCGWYWMRAMLSVRQYTSVYWQYMRCDMLRKQWFNLWKLTRSYLHITYILSLTQIVLEVMRLPLLSPNRREVEIYFLKNILNMTTKIVKNEIAIIPEGIQ